MGRFRGRDRNAVTAPSLEFIVPGDPQTVSGGYGYDRRIIAGLGALGWQITVHVLDASFPHPTEAALAGAHSVLAGLREHALVLVDGLALGAMPQVARAHCARLDLVALVHHPLAAETGLSLELASRLQQSEQQALQTVRRVIVTSRATQEALLAYAIAPERMAVAEPGTDEAPLARGGGGGAVRMLCVGAVIPRKGHDVLIEALARLAPLGWQLTCVGSLTRSPHTVELLRSQLRRSALVERVRFVGEVDDNALEGLFRHADLFVLPARFEGYGMAVAEALARGLPVISTRTGAIPELVGTTAGLLVAPGDALGLRAALARVLNEPGLLAALAYGAAAVRATLTSWSQACERMSQVLQEVRDHPRELLP